MGQKLSLFLTTSFVCVLTACASKPIGARRGPSSQITRIAIYSGPGSCEGCPQEIQALTQKLGRSLKIDLLPASRVRSEILKDYDLFIQPGGERTVHVQNAIGASGMQALREYVRGGGRYVGICLGANLAAEGLDDNNQPLLGLLPVKSYDTGNTAAHMGEVEVHYKGYGRRQAYLEDPPYLQVVREAARVKVLASYANGSAAAVAGRFGSGSVLLIGPHFEADNDWATTHGLKDRDGSEQFIFLDMLREMLGSTNAPLISSPAGGVR